MIRLVLALVFTACFTLATMLEPRFQALRPQSSGAGGVVGALMGETRELFATQSFIEADVYFHSGSYPTMFDKETELDMNSQEADTNNVPLVNGRKHVDEEAGEGFLGPPRDWLERFGRHFIPTEHTHLASVKLREILPWLRMSADLDPHRVQTYVTASFWLRTAMNQPGEAKQFLREGLRANPDSFEILVELGYVFDQDEKNPRVARNLFDAALQKWNKQAAAGLESFPKDKAEIMAKAKIEILDGLVRTDEELNDLKQLLEDLEALKVVSPYPAGIEKTIQETRAKLGAPLSGRPD
jgi:tetratricopeptide (TPR) repeat protein